MTPQPTQKRYRNMMRMERLFTTFLLCNVIFTCHGFSWSTTFTKHLSVAPSFPKETLLLPTKVAAMDDNETSCNTNSSIRRHVLNLLGTTLLPFHSFSAFASSDESTVLVKGTVSLPPNMLMDEYSSSAALYITCRPNRPDNVPQAILQGTRGKAPPVLAARFDMKPSSSFPFDFQLTSNDVTLEGAASSSNTNNENASSLYWWSRNDLIVSARLDSDGVASSRSPEDLVGRGMYMHSTNNGENEKHNDVSIELQGRGSFGKFATRKSTTS